MTPIQQMLLGVGAVAKKTYVDDMFSTYVYKGNESARAINNGIDLSGKGGLVWVKSRNDTHDHHLVDTVRGANDILESNTSDAEATVSNRITGFNSNGFNLGSAGQVNGTSSYDYASWTFRKAPGFFDVVTWNGSNSDQVISHSLGCVPGCIMIKRTDTSQSWVVYHAANSRSGYVAGSGKYLKLDSSDQSINSTIWQSTVPTSTGFTLKGNMGYTNQSGGTYVGYVFAGGKSTAATASSVNFNAGSDYLTTQSSSYNFGTGDFTIEFWTKLDTAIGTNETAAPGFFQLGTSASLQDDFKFMVVRARNDSGGRWQMLIKSTSTTNPTTYSSADGDYPHPGQWYHVALVRHSSKTSLYVNGERKIGPIDDTTNYNFDDMLIGSYYSNNYGLDGQISNFRIVKGSAVYTSSFKPPTAPLTSITNTILLCCQSSTITAATTIPGTQTISSNGSPAANTSHPFDDPAGFVFGDAGDQNVIKCGSYEGNNADDGTEVFLGFEPSFLLIKSADTADNWCIFDNLRGMTVDGVNDQALFPNASDSEAAGGYLTPTSTGFKLTTQSDRVNNNSTYIYMAIRRPDGYVGKPPELGTGVFAMDTGDDSSTIPNYDSGFPVDFAFKRYTATSNNWQTSARLIQGKYLDLNDSDAEGTSSGEQYDSNVGYNKDQSPSTVQAWMWKRHAGFDVVTYTGDGVDGRWIPHSMNKAPEMVWIKRRSHTGQWVVGHKGLDGGTAPWTHYLTLETTDAEGDYPLFHDTAPTSTHFKVNGHGEVNGDDKTFIAMLFASVDGISKVGSYAGSNSTQTITTGFQPRFVIIKNITENGSDWAVFDTVRGWGSGVDERLRLNSNAAENDDDDVGAPTSTGFTVNNIGFVNESGANYIYYAHA